MVHLPIKQRGGPVLLLKGSGYLNGSLFIDMHHIAISIFLSSDLVFKKGIPAIKVLFGTSISQVHGSPPYHLGSSRYFQRSLNFQTKSYHKVLDTHIYQHNHRSSTITHQTIFSPATFYEIFGKGSERRSMEVSVRRKRIVRKSAI